MFDERAAMKMRLEQIQDLEIRIIQEFQKERSQILNRIRELDGEAETTNATYKIIKPETTIASAQVKTKSQRQKNKRKHTTLTKEAIKVLKEHSAAISGKEIAASVEKSTGKSVGNITQFMNRVMTTDFKVKKPYRGQYIYEKQSSSPIEDMEPATLSVSIDGGSET
ncbi:Rok-like winged helix domain-containing protein [Bacillus sp. UMB0893]|uniref:Rok-like winged helix domain-containing protein n=1 Tax=Bacillus sp. UMB0893 TaxID=2066053 RepID=UPI000C78F18B|nr:hypothetical protein [Bacillus sp. UMB0893]PLR65558.1 hypothetical protein CYJ36_23125 [Bacillus sp. UMB0893]